jgi:tetratricopeptide (TPR) repeat protein
MSGMFLAGITIIGILKIKRRPYFAVGWFWFVGTLIPVIGLIQVGSQTMADRYAYIPLIGLFIVFAWAVSDFLKSVPIRKSIFILIAGLLALICGAKAMHQVTTWKTDQQFYGHMLQVTSNNYLAHNGMGLVMSRQGEPERAIDHFKEAIRIKPDYSDAYNNIGRELFRQGKIKDAMIQYKASISHNPKSAKAHNNYAVALACIESPAEAVKHFQRAIAIYPDYVSAHLNLAKLFIFENKMDLAVANFQKVLKLDPRNRDAANYLHQVTAVRKKRDD